MTNEEIVAAVKAWQADTRRHPLTCSVDMGHDLMAPAIESGRVILVCPTCRSRQVWIPDVVLKAKRPIRKSK